MKITPFISLLFVLLLANTSLAASVTPEKYLVTEAIQNYNLNGQNNSLQLACEIGQYVSETYGWNCDIRQLNFTKHAPVYINVFYPAADNKKGYEAYYGWFGPQKKEVTGFTKDKKMYYRDWYKPGNECYISGLKSYGIVQSYWGNVTTDPVEIVEPNETTDPGELKYKDIPDVEVYDNTFVNSEKVTDNNITVIKASGNQSIGDNSTNGVNNQGYIDTIKQYWFDLKNANLNNVTFNFWK